MAGFPVGGPSGLNRADAGALMQNLRSSSAPANPTTPNTRTTVSDERLDALQKVRKSLELVDRTISSEELVLKALIDGIRTAIVKLLQDQSPEAVLQSITNSLGAGMTPPAPTPIGQPPMPMGPTAGAPAMPPGGAVPPVSPGLPPG